MRVAYLFHRLQARVATEEDARRVAEVDKKKAVAEAAEARSDANHFKQQVEKLRQDLEDEKKGAEEVMNNIRKLVPGISMKPSARPRKSEDQ